MEEILNSGSMGLLPLFTGKKTYIRTIIFMDEFAVNDNRKKVLDKILNDLPYVKKKINKLLYEISKKKYDFIPLKVIFESCELNGLVPLMEDNTRWSGILCGESAQTYFTLGWISTEVEKDGYKFYTPIDKACLTLSWYKFESGRYEINTYIG
jgi:hypothetical protein